jgi:hypothetical protein
MNKQREFDVAALFATIQRARNIMLAILSHSQGAESLQRADAALDMLQMVESQAKRLFHVETPLSLGDRVRVLCGELTPSPWHGLECEISEACEHSGWIMVKLPGHGPVMLRQTEVVKL